jgi:predicted alpha/beta superfamily hydrolase
MRSSQLRVHSGFRSRFLPGDRDVTVYLPPGYEENADRHYPVLYMQDGQNLFGAGSSSGSSCSSWRLAESADAAIEAGEVEPLIIIGIGVGIANAGERRTAEYTPTNDWKLGGGEADRYGRLLVEELVPFIAANYRARAGAESTGMGGSSLGGLATLYLGLNYDEVFGKLAVLSPSVWWNHRAVLDIVSGTALKGRGRPRIWLDIGDAEGRRPLADVDLLARRLRIKGWRIGVDLKYERIPGGTHDEAAWAQRVRPMLRFLFPA